MKMRTIRFSSIFSNNKVTNFVRINILAKTLHEQLRFRLTQRIKIANLGAEFLSIFVIISQRNKV